MYQSGKATIYIIPCTINLKPSSKAEHEKLKKKQSEKELEHLFRLAKMAAARAVSAMALFFLVTLCASQMVSSLRPGVGLGTCRASGTSRAALATARRATTIRTAARMARCTHSTDARRR
jgi:hypothetical protein